MDRPITTLFMLMSFDGKISPGASDKIDGKSILSESELKDLGVLKLVECTVLEDSYIRVRYEVV